MSNTWRWIFGILFGLFILGLLFVGGANRRAYRTARGAIEQRVEISQDGIDAVADLAIAAVDLALERAGDLPSQQAQADLITQDIEEISNRLKEAADARGDLAIERLDSTIDLFNQVLDTIDNAANETDSEVAQQSLDRIYGILEAAQTQIVELINRVGG